MLRWAWVVAGLVSTLVLSHPQHQGELSSTALASSSMLQRQEACMASSLCLGAVHQHPCHQSQLHCVTQWRFGTFFPLMHAVAGEGLGQLSCTNPEQEPYPRPLQPGPVYYISWEGSGPLFWVLQLMNIGASSPMMLRWRVDQVLHSPQTLTCPQVTVQTWTSAWPLVVIDPHYYRATGIDMALRWQHTRTSPWP